MIDEREVLELIEGLLRPDALELMESKGDDVIETVGKVVDEWVFVVIKDSLVSTENDTAGETDESAVMIDVSDASIE